MPPKKMDNMKISDVKVGKVVQCPVDRGGAPYQGRIVRAGAAVCKSYQGIEYGHVSVKGDGATSVWPSNRLA